MGKPDWRNPNDYAQMDGFTPSQWAWEFLRRNTEYINSWNRYIEYLSLPDDSAQPVAEELWGAWKWGLQGLYLDPDESYSNVAFLPIGGKEALMIFQPPKKEGEEVRYVGYIGRPKVGKVIIEFDVSLPIKKQLHIAEKTLLQHRIGLRDEGVTVQETPKLRRDPDEWKILLRVLDADAEVPKQKDKEIANILFPQECPLDKKAKSCPLDNATIEIKLDSDIENKCPLADGTSDKKCPLENPYFGTKKVTDKRKQAKKYRDHYYRFIPYSEK